MRNKERQHVATAATVLDHNTVGFDNLKLIVSSCYAHRRDGMGDVIEVANAHCATAGAVAAAAAAATTAAMTAAAEAATASPANRV
jgi:hypothetical protein